MYMNKLSSAERMRRFYNGQIIDRVPVFSCATMYAGWEKGLTSEEFYFDVAKAFQAQKELYEEGYDDLPCYDLPHGEILDFGGELIINQTGRVSLPFVKRFPIDSLEEAWKYELPPMSERRYTKYYVKFLEYAEKQGQMGVSISAGSPFTMIGSMVDTGLLMRWLVKEPDVVHHLLNIAINYLNESADLLIQKFGIERCSVSSNYPFESNCLISPKIFEKYAYPAMLKIHKDLRLKGLENFGIHLCGNHDNTIGGITTIECGSGSTTQHRHSFNIFGVNHGSTITGLAHTGHKVVWLCCFQRRHRNTIDYIQGVIISGKRFRTTHHHLSSTTDTG